MCMFIREIYQPTNTMHLAPHWKSGTKEKDQGDESLSVSTALEKGQTTVRIKTSIELEQKSSKPWFHHLN